MADGMTGGASGSETGRTDGAADKVREMKDHAQEKVADVTAEARDRGEHMVEEGKEKARELGHQAAEMARSRGDEQRERVAEGVRSFAFALRRGADDLPAERREYERYIDDVADRVESVSRYIEERDVEALTREARRFARDHTPLFLTGAFAAGLMGARFLKSSGDGARDSHSDRSGLARDRWTQPAERTGRYDQATGHQPTGYQAGGYQASGSDQPATYRREGPSGRPSQGAEGDGYA